ncbi:MAG: DEAD/DEAH box helicase [Planctomycetes bacterium]|nr:DEAD/DEAH box helicase [Planctomycetota bacterium]
MRQGGGRDPDPAILRAMHFKGYTLNSFQVQAVRAIAEGKNVLLSAPTGSGKTLVAEFAIERAVRQDRRAIYTSPIKALSNQKFRDFKADGVEVGLMTGDLTLDPHAPVVIMTTEIFRNSVFEDPLRFEDVDFVIFDEIHFLDDPERGTVWEESLIFAPPHVRFVGLSATISNLEQFGGWLASVRTQELEIIRHDQRPVPLRHKLFHPAAGIFDLAQKKRATALIRRQAERERAGIRRAHFARQRRRHKETGPSRRSREQIRLAHQAAEQLLDSLQRERLLPVLYFCFSRKECEIKAERNAWRPLLGRQEQMRMDTLFGEICAKFELQPERDPVLQGIRERALRGVGFHHAGMLPIHKEVVERLFTSGLLRMLFTTETFALGINMPARTVVFDALRKFDGVSIDYLRARDYMQMAGRAGRQGMDAEGLVISLVDEEDLEEAPLVPLFNGTPEPILSRFNLSYSTILNLYERMGGELVGAYDRSFAAFQAATGSLKVREKKRSAARAALLARISVLERAGYLDRNGLLPRGRIAQQVNGYEIQVTELIFSGILDRLDIHQLGALFASLVYEERRGGDGDAAGRAAFGPRLAHEVDQVLGRFVTIEHEHGFAQTVKPAGFGIAAAALRWAKGDELGAVGDLLAGDSGDFVRTLRMAIQMLRQLRKSLSGDYPLIDRLDEAVVALNRDEVDAKRQFELG